MIVIIDNYDSFTYNIVQTIAAYVVDDRGIRDQRRHFRVLVQQRRESALEFVHLVLTRVDRDDLGQRFGNEIRVLVDNAVIQAQRGLVVVGIARDVSARQRATHCPRPPRLGILHVLPRRRIVPGCRG